MTSQKPKKTGRPRTSVGWATISIRLPIPTVEAYRRLPEIERSRVQARLREIVEKAITPKP